MTIIEEYVDIRVYNYIEHYERLGYKIPRRKNSQGRMTIELGFTLRVKVDDLLPRSRTLVTKKCDNCGNIQKNVKYGTIMSQRRENGYDYCHSCAISIGYKIKKEKMPFEESVAFTHPDVAKMFKNPEKARMVSYGSRDKTDFICPYCDSELKDVYIYTVTRRGLFCSSCSDGVSYPEKLLANVLRQLNLGFEHNTTFSWSKNRRYDFFIEELDCIIETHGIQHYENGFEGMGGRSLEEEQKNDKLKKKLAGDNFIENYIVIDCRWSDMDFIRRNIERGLLASLCDVSIVDWDECHKLSRSPLVDEVSKKWNSGVESIEEIANSSLVSAKTAIKYLKQASEMGLCDYCHEESSAKEKKRKIMRARWRVIQLSLLGEYIATWGSSIEASSKLNISKSGIIETCNGRSKTAGGFMWLYESDYVKKDSVEAVKPVAGRGVLQLDFRGNILDEFVSISEACRVTGLSSISQACRGINSRAGNYFWVYKENYDSFIKDELPYIFMKKPRKKHRKQKGGKIVQMNLEGEVIHVWGGAKEIEEKTGINKANIYACCYGTRKATGGYKWMYKIDHDASEESEKH